MMRFLMDNWYRIGLVAVVLAMVAWDARQTFVLASTALILLHFFEEFGFPGAFPGSGSTSRWASPTRIREAGRSTS